MSEKPKVQSEGASLTADVGMPEGEIKQESDKKFIHEEEDHKPLVPIVMDTFEGPEKLLEIWFLKPDEVQGAEGEKEVKTKPLKKCSGEGKDGLRSLERKCWEETLKLVRCAILNVVSNDYFDAYLLSESSLFVWPQKIILKTCGTTTLLLALPAILELAKGCGLTIVSDIFYSRRNYFFAAKQLPPHSSFEDEVKFLDGLFDGSAYVLGFVNKDHWYLYLTDKDELADNSAPRAALQRLPTIQLSKVQVEADPDFTLEILMTNLDEKVMKQFYKANLTAREVTKSSGIGDLFPDAVIDDYLFDPCGYSMNGLVDNGYFTIHITPQPICSYVSFETNIHCDFSALVERVLKVFRPSSFTVTLFAGHIDKDSFTKMSQTTLKPRLTDGLHVRRTYTKYEFENNYDLAFAFYDHGKKRKL